MTVAARAAAWWWTLLNAACIAAASPTPPVAFLWGEGARPAGPLVDATPEEAWVGLGEGMRVAYAWHRVREISGAADRADPDAGAEDIAAWLATGKDLWRAVTRLQRGDDALAEPIFESLALTYPVVAGPTSAAVHEGLLRCRLRRGAHASAIEPWLELIRGGGIEAPTRFAGVGPLTAPGSPLIPGLPPLWVPGPATAAFATGPTPEQSPAASQAAAPGLGVGAALERLYRESARRAENLGTPDAGFLSPPPGGEHPAVTLVRQMVLAQSDDPAVRAQARDALGGLAPVTIAGGEQAWNAAWVRVATGLSQTREPELEPRLRGVLTLVTVRVDHANDAPYLAGLALAHAAVTMADLPGGPAAAAALAEDLRATFPGHPALRWDRLTAIVAPAPVDTPDPEESLP